MGDFSTAGSFGGCVLPADVVLGANVLVPWAQFFEQLHDILSTCSMGQFISRLIFAHFHRPGLEKLLVLASSLVLAGGCEAGSYRTVVCTSRWLSLQLRLWV